MLPPDFNFRIKDRVKKSEQVFPLLALTTAWGLFVISALNYKLLPWFPWLIGSRITLVTMGLGLLLDAVIRRNKNENTIFWFFLFSLAVQASHGALEPSRQTEFYNFTGVLFLATNLVYRGTFQTWLKFYAPFQLALMALPLAFKSKQLLFPLGNFIDHFSLPVAGVAIGTIIARINSVKYQALLDVIRLQREVLSEKKKTLDREQVLRVSLEAALANAKEEIRKESRIKALGEIAAQVAHDIRSPLAALDTVVVGIQNIPEEKRIIIRSAAGRIRDIANYLLDKNQTKTLQKVPSFEEQSEHLLSSLIDTLITEKRIQFRSKLGVEISANLDATAYGLFARVQAIEFKRLLSNLINNAVESLDNQGWVNVSLQGLEGIIELRVSDSGKGISPAVIAKLMNRGETHGKVGGSGLGLYHARKTVEDLQGSLRLESVVGTGTNAIISLPRSKPPEWFVEKLAIFKNTEIAILDDDESIHQIWRGRFESLKIQEEQIQLHHFSTPEDLMKWNRPDQVLFLLDYELLGDSMTGLDVIEKLGIQDQSILVTSRFEETTIREHCTRLKVRLIPKDMAGFVPITIQPPDEKWDAILIDDDSLVHMTWANAARLNKKRIKSYYDPKSFFEDIEKFNRESPIYVDSNLGNDIQGEDLIPQIKAMGFQRIFLATGYDPEEFKNISGLTGVTGKEPPHDLGFNA